MPRKLLVSGLALVAAASVVGGATFAKFSDSEVSAKQSIKAGTLDIQFDDTTLSNSAIGFPINLQDVKPGDSGNTQMIHVSNHGSVAATVAIKIQKTDDADNGCNEPELEAEANCAADDLGELDSNMTLALNGYVGVENVLEGLAVGESALVRDLNGTAHDSIVTLAPGADKWLSVVWGVNDAAGNDIQSDSIGFKVVFEATQA